MADITLILAAAEAGDPNAAAELLPLVYDELRKLAAARLAGEAPGHSLDATALVHEAYLRLMPDAGPPATFESRGHFFAAAAKAMRRILVESARRKRRLKRGGGRQRVDLDRVAVVTADGPGLDLLALDEALDRLAEVEPEVARLVQLRHFAGLSVKQAAEVLGVSPRTADAWWAYARSWLLAELGGEAAGEKSG
jgi:RNA polymerase sigma factor (TIGR02999 family)